MPPASRKISVEDLPVEYRPIGMRGYFGYSLLFAIPFVGWIIALVFAFGVNPNVNLKNFARAYFCSLIVACVFLFFVSVSGCSLLCKSEICSGVFCFRVRAGDTVLFLHNTCFRLVLSVLR